MQSLLNGSVQKRMVKALAVELIAVGTRAADPAGRDEGPDELEAKEAAETNFIVRREETMAMQPVNVLENW